MLPESSLWNLYNLSCWWVARNTITNVYNLQTSCSSSEVLVSRASLPELISMAVNVIQLPHHPPVQQAESLPHYLFPLSPVARSFEYALVLPARFWIFQHAAITGVGSSWKTTLLMAAANGLDERAMWTCKPSTHQLPSMVVHNTFSSLPSAVLTAFVVWITVVISNQRRPPTCSRTHKAFTGTRARASICTHRVL